MLLSISSAGIQSTWKDYVIRRQALRLFQTLHELPFDAPAYAETWATLERWLERTPRHKAIWRKVEREWRESHERSARVRAGLCNCEYCQKPIRH
jgi:ferric-dicitrate binding protein FerR (iron transport regulator)